MKALAEYERKRDFLKTTEPRPGKGKRSPTAPRLFVIQKHAASRLHYDFRLEMGGTLKSWAVPKGIPYEQGEKRLAVPVEDHPLDYARFEGIIPKGSYGSGTVMVWDIGEYAVSGDDPLAAYASGKLHLQLHGKKLHGEWTLVRTRNLNQGGEAEGEGWLLMKTGGSVPPQSRRSDDKSAISGRTMRQISADPESTWHAAARDADQTPAEHGSKRKVAHPKFLEPMKAKVVSELPKLPGWIFEVKFDGYRAIALKEGAKVSLLSRNHKPLQFPEVAEAVAKLPCRSAALDGEIVMLDASGRPSFQLLQSREMGELSGGDAAALCYYLFDLLHLDGTDLRQEPLLKRKKLLSDLLAGKGTGSFLRLSSALPGDPSEILAQIKAQGLEGIVAKRTDSEYEVGGRSGAWVKVKCLNEEEFVIGGFTVPKGSRSHLGALLVGYFENGKLHFAGKVGTGFTERMLERLAKEFEPLRIAECPFSAIPNTRNRWTRSSGTNQFVWAKPELVCEIRFTEWTRDGRLRHPVFLGLRTDKSAREVTREAP